MPLSFWLLATLAGFMLADYWQTVVGLSRGAVESNAVPCALEAKFGPIGLAMFQGATFVVVALIVVPQPEQWGAPLLGVIFIGIAIINNGLALRKLRAVSASTEA